jgi:hypothetical protein
MLVKPKTNSVGAKIPKASLRLVTSWSKRQKRTIKKYFVLTQNAQNWADLLSIEENLHGERGPALQYAKARRRGQLLKKYGKKSVSTSDNLTRVKH